MNRYYTSIEESKKLIELGLKAETSDMYYQSMEDDIPNTHPMIIDGDYYKGEDIPCWSVGQLLELMPKEIEDDDKNTCWFGFVAYNQEWYVYYTGDGFPIVEYKGNNIMELLYNMIVWLLQNNYIKTE